MSPCESRKTSPCSIYFKFWQTKIWVRRPNYMESNSNFGLQEKVYLLRIPKWGDLYSDKTLLLWKIILNDREQVRPSDQHESCSPSCALWECAKRLRGLVKRINATRAQSGHQMNLVKNDHFHLGLSFYFLFGFSLIQWVVKWVKKCLQTLHTMLSWQGDTSLI